MRASSRRWRGWYSWLALISFAFAQLAVAAYVCPNADDATQWQHMAAGEGDCHRGGTLADPDNAQLCKAYCERGAQAKPNAPADPPDLADVAPPILIVRSTPPRVFQQSTSCRAPHAGPPLYLRNCVLRN